MYANTINKLEQKRSNNQSRIFINMLIKAKLSKETNKYFLVEIVDSDFSCFVAIPLPYQAYYVPAQSLCVYAIIKEYKARKLNVAKAVASFFSFEYELHPCVEEPIRYYLSKCVIHYNNHYVTNIIKEPFISCVLKQLKQIKFSKNYR